MLGEIPAPDSPAAKQRLLHRGYTFWVCLILAVATIAVYWQVHDYDFVNYDDQNYVYENRHIKTGLTVENIVWAFTSSHAANWHPLTSMAHMLDCELFGLNPGAHHLVSLFFHVVNTLLMFWVFKRMTGAFWRSAFVAALFALHPLHVESVVWISERKDVLSTLFWLLTMLWYLRYVERTSKGRYLLVLLAFSVGLMFKPMLVTLPFVLLLLDYWPLGRFDFVRDVEGDGRGGEKTANTRFQWPVFYRLVLEKVPFFIISVISSVVTFLIEKYGGTMAGTDLLPVDIRIANTFISYVK